MRENILIFVLGIFAKIIWDLINQKRSQKRKDRKTLIQVRNTLADFKAIYVSDKKDKTAAEYLDELHGLTFEVRRKENRDIRNKIEEFVQENRGRDPISSPALQGKIISLKSEVEETLKKGGQ